MERPLIIALDFPSLHEVKEFLHVFEKEKLYVKVGMELFYKEGPSILSFLKENGHRIFLDLKLHDIPNTVKSAMKNIAGYEIDLVNVHAAGGKKMMEAALEGLDAGTATGRKRPNCIAVTQLTSTSEEVMQNELRLHGSLQDVVVHYARLAQESKLDGVVCSTWEAKEIRDACGEAFLKVTPGIRLPSDDVNDQVRIATPSKANKLGSTAIVVGRTITKANKPVEAYKHVKQEWELV